MTVFQLVKSDLTGRLPEVLADLLPGGIVRGSEYLCASLRGGQGHSCSTNISTGVGSDFATNEKWGDVIDLASQVWGTGQMEAAQKLQERYGVNGSIRLAPPASPVDDGWTLIQPIPENAPELPGGYSGKWCYHDAVGAELFYVLRFEEPSGGKRVQPVSYWRDKDGDFQWRFKMPPGLRPLYGLDHLANAAPILLTEGEKTTDAAQAIFPEYICMTWSGGVNATGKSDFSPLAGRDVVIWPDNDAPGMKAAAELSQVLGKIAQTVRIVSLPESLPTKWDLADPAPDGFDLRVHLNAAIVRNALTEPSPLPPAFAVNLDGLRLRRTDLPACGAKLETRDSPDGGKHSGSSRTWLMTVFTTRSWHPVHGRERSTFGATSGSWLTSLNALDGTPMHGDQSGGGGKGRKLPRIRGMDNPVGGNSLL